MRDESLGRIVVDRRGRGSFLRRRGPVPFRRYSWGISVPARNCSSRLGKVGWETRRWPRTALDRDLVLPRAGLGCLRRQSAQNRASSRPRTRFGLGLIPTVGLSADFLQSGVYRFSRAKKTGRLAKNNWVPFVPAAADRQVAADRTIATLVGLARAIKLGNLKKASSPTAGLQEQWQHRDHEIA